MELPHDRLGGSDRARADHRRPMVEHAIELAEFWPVFPLVPGGKVPLISKARGGNGCHDATTDLDQVRAWWRRCPRANIGVACGTALWVLDVDRPKEGQPVDGLDTIADLEDAHRWLPVGPASMTGRGGMHLPFAPDTRVETKTGHPSPGLDTRAAGGYVVAPPSVHENGTRYTWLPGREPWSLPLPTAPGWLLDLLDPPKVAFVPVARTPRPRRKINTPYIEGAVRRELERVGHAGQGQRNATLFVAAAALGRFVAAGKLDARAIGLALVSEAMATGLPRAEAERTVLSGLDAALRGAA